MRFCFLLIILVMNISLFIHIKKERTPHLCIRALHILFNDIAFGVFNTVALGS